MRVYLAARYGRHQEMLEKSKELWLYRIPVTSRWIHGEHEMEDHNPENNSALAAQFAREDLEDLRQADTLIAFAEATRGRGGRHVELGYALALGHRIIMVGGHEHVFSYLPEIIHMSDWAEVINWIPYVA